MNSLFLKKSLVNTPETKATVSAELHQNVMRAVRLAKPVGRSSRFFRSTPAWGAGVLAMLLVAVFFYLPQTAPVSQVTQDVVAQTKTEPQSQSDPLLVLGESLLIFSEETAAPEQALRKELERLKSDLARFDFRS
ncbi:MAG: hypothetical protein OEU84_03570 [Xanthomonadales bacterium]|nr:hypothetical protein [Xanthomonadales bacterium]